MKNLENNIESNPKIESNLDIPNKIENKNYSKNIFQIYVWEIVNILSNFLSFFIVVPKITGNQTIYGIYSICISISIFLSYVDFGFMPSCQKYAAEAYAQNDLEKEMKMVGFLFAFMMIVILLYMAIALILSIFPQLLIKDLVDPFEIKIASQLLLVLALSTPIVIINRVIQIIFAIRIEDYIIKRFNIFSNLIKILSVLYFFRLGSYDIVGYFLFSQFMNLIVVFLISIIATKKYNYDFRIFIRFIRLSKEIFKTTKALAFNSLFATIAWILYYELDLILIGRFLGANAAAIFGISGMLMTFIRTLIATLYAPFASRFNHFIGVKDNEGLRKLFSDVVLYTFPIISIPIIALNTNMKYIIFTWVGNAYFDSILITQFLIFCFLFNSITIPTASVLIAQEKIKELYLVNGIMVIIYWVGIISTISLLSTLSFALWKFMAFLFAAIFYFIFFFKYTKLNKVDLLKSLLLYNIIPICTILLLNFLMAKYLSVEKGIVPLFTNFIYIGIISGIGLFIYIVQSKEFRNFVKILIKEFVKR